MKRDFDLIREIALDLRLNHAKRWPLHLTNNNGRL